MFGFEWLVGWMGKIEDQGEKSRWLFERKNKSGFIDDFSMTRSIKWKLNNVTSFTTNRVKRDSFIVRDNSTLIYQELAYSG